VTRDTGSLELAHARIAARWGARPDDALWRRIETTHDLDAMLALARASSLVQWLGSIEAGTGLHATEQLLRQRWRQRADEVAAWMPPAWQPSLRWCAELIELPGLQPWARGRPLPAWATTHAKTGDDGSATLLERWLARWRQLLPRHGGRAAIERHLLPLLEGHRRAFAAPHTVDGWALRRELQARLVLLLRRHAVEPVEAFVYLALCAVELERLRGEITRRAAFPSRDLAA
jgi:hypothetical protein